MMSTRVQHGTVRNILKHNIRLLIRVIYQRVLCERPENETRKLLENSLGTADLYTPLRSILSLGQVHHHNTSYRRLPTLLCVFGPWKRCRTWLSTGVTKILFGTSNGVQWAFTSQPPAEIKPPDYGRQIGFRRCVSTLVT